MNKLLAIGLVFFLTACGMQHAGCPTDLPQAPDDTTGVKSALRTCN